MEMRFEEADEVRSGQQHALLRVLLQYLPKQLTHVMME